jgi:hypothetical protein
MLTNNIVVLFNFCRDIITQQEIFNVKFVGFNLKGIPIVAMLEIVDLQTNIPK